MAFSMGDCLRAEVERQLLLDLAHYGIAPTGLWIDWSDCTQEGHCTNYLDGFLASSSSVMIRNAANERLYDGWMDFIHGGEAHPLFVFWLFLTKPIHADEYIDLKADPHIPAHIWTLLPESSKWLCAKRGEYDAAWQDDPLVLAWLQEKKQAYFARASATNAPRGAFQLLAKLWGRSGKK